MEIQLHDNTNNDGTTSSSFSSSPLVLFDIQQINFRTMNPQAIFMTCSSEIINRIQFGTLKSQAQNMMSIPTDCNQRDERLGWMV